MWMRDSRGAPNGPSFTDIATMVMAKPILAALAGGRHSVGSGPIFTGERGGMKFCAGHDATPYLNAMLHFSNQGGMIPEQVVGSGGADTGGICVWPGNWQRHAAGHGAWRIPAAGGLRGRKANCGKRRVLWRIIS